MSDVTWLGNMRRGSGLRCWVRVAAVAALAACLLMIGLPRVFGVSSQDAATAIAGADHALQAAFVSVSDTEKAEVNVSGLLNRLDEAGFALNMAEAASNSGNYSEAVNQAVASEALAEGIAKDAVAMKGEAVSWYSSFLPILEMGVVGAGVLVVVLVLTWFLFKRYYGRKLLGSRPEVTG
jgi:hypothetical protein